MKAGIPMSVPAVNVNKVCLSGLNAIYLADQMIAAGDADIVVAGGMESMTNAPYIADGARGGFRYGNTELRRRHHRRRSVVRVRRLPDGPRHRALRQPARSPASSRTSWREVQRAGRRPRSRTAGSPTRSLPVAVPQRKGDPIIVETDEGVRPGTTIESLGGLRPAFDKDGTITAGNASQISDGGSRRGDDVSGPRPSGSASPRSVRSSRYGMVAGPDNASLLHQPSRAIMRALGTRRHAVADVDLFEINEAFAAVGIASMADLGITDEIVNVNGGAIALGHPIGMSGNRLALTLLHELKRRGGGIGAVALCGGGGQGDAAILRTV